jgi:methoxymalonate biosynthesis acyl carrier protein
MSSKKVTILATKPLSKPIETAPPGLINGDQTIQGEIAKLFNNVLNVDVPLPTTDLLESGILDSQKFVELLLHLEQKFDAKIDVEDLEIENFRSIETITNLVSRRK